MKLPAMPVRSGRDATMNFEKLAKQIPTYVTSLPSQPTDGQEVYYQSAAMAAVGWVWHLRYRPSSPQANKWEFIGGSVIDDSVYALQGTASAVNVDLATVGPKLTIPISGVYYFSMSVRMVCVAANSQPVVSLMINGAESGYNLVFGQAAAFVQASVAKAFVGLVLTAGDVLKMQYRNTGAAGEVQFVERTLNLYPVRVG